MDGLKNSMFGGLVSGFVGSLCCVTPLVLVLLGLSGVAGAMGLAGTLQENFRWTLFIPLAVVFLITSIYLHIRSREGVCNLGQLKNYKAYIIGTVLFALIIWALLIYAIVPFLFKMVS